jgi:hypothetical protein
MDERHNVLAISPVRFSQATQDAIMRDIDHRLPFGMLVRAFLTMDTAYLASTLASSLEVEDIEKIVTFLREQLRVHLEKGRKDSSYDSAVRTNESSQGNNGSGNARQAFGSTGSNPRLGDTPPVQGGRA